MRADTKSVEIQSSPSQVFEFLATPENLPRWAIGFAKAVTRVGDQWVVTTGGGMMTVRVDADPRTGTIDFYLAPPAGIEAMAASRVVPNGAGTEYVFTQFQAPGMPEEIFAKNVRALEHELTVLKALLEVECPL